jgi:mRNA-degrading endonuclease YafQ of YafQ-DinJ toxin-antitoxin module
MKKLDEIMELMADEMADFKSAILQLQKLSRQLYDLSIPISTEALEKNLNAFLRKQELESQERDDILKSIDKKLKNARIIPDYLLILFGALEILALGLIGYFGYSNDIQQEENFKIYRIIMESETNLQQDFFAAHPEIKEEYCQWLEDQK